MHRSHNRAKGGETTRTLLQTVKGCFKYTFKLDHRALWRYIVYISLCTSSIADKSQFKSGSIISFCAISKFFRATDNDYCERRSSHTSEWERLHQYSCNVVATLDIEIVFKIVIVIARRIFCVPSLDDVWPKKTYCKRKAQSDTPAHVWLTASSLTHTFRVDNCLANPRWSDADFEFCVARRTELN